MSTTETPSLFNNLESLSTQELLVGMNSVDQTVPQAVAKALPQIEALVDATVARLGSGGRLFYIGAGTSGRLGILDASECPPTFGVPHGVVIGLIAGGDTAIRKAVENAEDDAEKAWQDLLAYDITNQDIVVGIAASGRTPYVIGGLEQARRHGLATGCIVCNAGSAVAAVAEYPVEVVTGPEFVTGSTRLKAGTAQKLVLNMITTATFIRLGRVRGNKMVDMQLSNAKLVDRGERMLMDELQISQPEAAELLRQHGSVRAALVARQ
ncbi:N-acetylmuramic acid 6-phosphate etherase [Hymenobacter taeanensis]|uniref:N-acetylmuramic acid 6-phosphate etherase n=1 Tax=Hymenobacter taeanensis TaxID=2735321 RepID=A0A6M6BF03_9BACT|nr:MULTISPECIES: N-acetylmuramic acid 6-phosphate etherase [Hymenobacter]QJX47161.1 N-acetylmuramic acid 6-phosphate etherase [Hymenobacter taeanensis]UOQ81079.1 N-acetylmuramic acid 6-phosphate etherase [Hymenobacter sp. 5414T-23]